MDASERLRWEMVGEDPQSRLFGSEVERVTHPEFADMEFLHVRSKSLINEVPGAAHLPFRLQQLPQRPQIGLRSVPRVARDPVQESDLVDRDRGQRLA